MKPVKTLFLKTKPISLNSVYKNAKRVGRVKTKEYNEWIKEVLWEIKLQNVGGQPVTGAFGLNIHIERGLTRADIDNLIKPIVDVMVKSGIIPDDRKMDMVSIQKSTLRGVCIEIYDMNLETQGE